MATTEVTPRTQTPPRPVEITPSIPAARYSHGRALAALLR